MSKTQRMGEDVEENLMDLEMRQKVKKEMETGDMTSNSTVELQVNVANRYATQDVATRVEQLFKFTREGNVSEVKSILASGVDVNALDANSYSLLHYAAENGNVTVCELLLDRGADVDAGEDTITPLHLASSKGHLPVVKLLISSGAFVNLYSSDFWTPLHYAVVHGHTAVCEYLLKKGSDIEALNEEKKTLLHIACSKGPSSMVKILISHGAALHSFDNLKRTPLHYAAEHGHLAVCQCLLDKGACIINSTDKDGKTPLMLACTAGHLSVVKLLVIRGAYCNTADNRQYGALHYAAQHGHLAVCQYLLDWGAAVNFEHDTATPLMLASSEGHLSVVKLLVMHGVKVDDSAYTAAERAGHISVAEYLYEKLK